MNLQATSAGDVLAQQELDQWIKETGDKR